MLLDFDVQRCTRECASTQRKLEPGDLFYSVLEKQGAEVIRKDISLQAWQGPPEGVLGWWQARMPVADSKKTKLAPNEVLLELFDQLAEQPNNQDMRYVLTLLLIRRRVLRQEERVPEEGRAGGEATLGEGVLIVFCPSRDETYEVTEAFPDEPRIEAIQTHLTELLYADTE